MSLTTPVLYIKPQTGQSAPRNEVGANESVTGGAYTLVDLGSGVMAWRPTSEGYINIPDYALTVGAAAGGVTLAIKLRIDTYPSASEDRFVNWAAALDGFEEGLQLRQGNVSGWLTGTFRQGGTTALYGAQWSAGTSVLTVVLRLRTAAAGAEAIDRWRTGGGGSSSTPDDTVTATLGSTTLRYLYIRAPAGATWNLLGLTCHAEELSGADCMSLLADIDSAAPASDLSGNVTLDAVAPAGTLADGGASGLSGGVTLDAVAPAGTLGVAPGAYSIPALTNWSGSVQAAVTVPWVTFQRLADGVQVLVLADQVTNGSGDLSGTNAALLVGTTYMVCGWDADGSSRFAKPVTAT